MISPRALALVDLATNHSRNGVSYHLAHKLAERGERVLVVDTCHDACLTESFLGPTGLSKLWSGSEAWWSSGSPITPIAVAEGLFLIPGDPQIALGIPASPGLRQQIADAAARTGSSWILLALAPAVNPWTIEVLRVAGALAVIAGSEPRSLRALPVAGRLLAAVATANLPETAAYPRPFLLGYLVNHPLHRIFGPNDVYDACLAKLPLTFRKAFDLPIADLPLSPEADPLCLGLLERPAGLYELANEAGKPSFQLKAADGASGSLLRAALDASRAYDDLAERIRLSCDAAKISTLAS